MLQNAVKPVMGFLFRFAEEFLGFWIQNSGSCGQSQRSLPASRTRFPPSSSWPWAASCKCSSLWYNTQLSLTTCGLHAEITSVYLYSLEIKCIVWPAIRTSSCKSKKYQSSFQKKRLKHGVSFNRVHLKNWQKAWAQLSTHYSPCVLFHCTEGDFCLS